MWVRILASALADHRTLVKSFSLSTSVKMGIMGMCCSQVGLPWLA